MKRLLFIISALSVALATTAQDLTLVELQNLCKLTNWETGHSTLTRKGWEYHDSRRGDSYNTSIIVYGYEKNKYNGRATAWVNLYTNGDKVEQVMYMATESVYKSVNTSIAANGYKKTDSDIGDGLVVTNYSSKQFLLKIAIKTEKQDYSDATFASYTILIIKKGGIYDEDNGEKVDYYYNSSTVKRRYTLKDGKINGKVYEYFRDGKTESVSNWTNGVLNGAFTTYDEDGKILSSGSYLNGKRHGVVTEYTDEGEKTVCTYKNGEIEGKFTIYHLNGKPKITGSIAKGEKNGQFVEYDEDGKIISSGNYLNGKKNGVFTEYTDEGEKTVFTYKNGEYDGKYTMYYLNGKTRITGGISNGEKNGQFVQYNEEGNKTYEYCYKNGKYEGKYIEYEYDDDGNLFGQLIGQYKDDEKDGRWETKVMSGGQLKTLKYSTYSDGILNGEAREWTGGDSVIFCSYTDGKLDGKYQVKASFMNLFFSPTGDKNSYITITDGNYTNGKKSGHWTYNNMMAKTEAEGYYINGEKEGVWNYFVPDFTPTDKILHKGDTVNVIGEDGRITQEVSEGSNESYNIEMRHSYTKTYKAGKLDGKVVAFNPLWMGEDSINYICHYYNGQKYGHYARYDLGLIVEEGEYYYGKRNGFWKEDSVLVYRSSGNYKNGNRDGVWTYYDFSNPKQLQKKCGYRDGKKDGTWEFYDEETGEKLETLNYKQDKLSGLQTKYSNNQISIVDEYDNGKVIGETIYENGNPKIKYLWKYDNKITIKEYKDDVEIITDHTTYYGDFKYIKLFQLQSSINGVCMKDGDYSVVDGKKRTIVSGSYSSNVRERVWGYYFHEQNLKCRESFDSRNEPLVFYNIDPDTPFSGQFKNKAIVAGQTYNAIYNIKKGLIQKVVYTDPMTGTVVLKEKCKKGIAADGKPMGIYVPYK